MFKKKYKVKIIAPASSCDNANKILEQSIQILNSHDCFEAYASEDIFCNTIPPFYSNTQEKRQKDLHEALLSDEVDIIWSFRGGYGSAELINSEILSLQPKNKILIGFSDITILHFLCNQVYNLRSIHGPNINNISLHKDELLLIKSYLLGNELNYELTPLNDLASNETIEGEICGGNLTMLTTLLATKLHPNLASKIVLLEDTGEKSYRIKRMLLQLQQSGVFEEIKAIILGDFILSDDYLEEVLNEFISFCHFPIFKIKSVGHGEQNYPIIFNNHVIINKSILKISGNIYEELYEI